MYQEKIDMYKQTQILEKYANAVDNVMIENFFYGRCSGGTISPNLMRFEFEYESGFSYNGQQLEEASIADKLARVLDCPRPELQPDTGNCIFVFRNPNPSAATFRGVWDLAPHEHLYALLGINDQDRAVTLNLNKIPHALITGNPGCGKSSLMRSIGLSLVLSSKPHDNFYFIGGTLKQAFRGISSYTYDRSPDDFVGEIYALMQRRHNPSGNIIIIIDEFRDFIYNAINIDEVIRQLAEIVRYGANAGINLICATKYYTHTGIWELLNQIQFPLYIGGTQLMNPNYPDYDLPCGTFFADDPQQPTTFNVCYVSTYDCMTWEIEQKEQE